MYANFVLVIFVLGGTWAACPPAEDILPCECDETSLRFFCTEQGSDNEEPWDIKATFDGISSLIPPDFVFDDLSIAITNLITIPAGAVQTIKFNQVKIYYNFGLTYIHPEAFGDTTNVTTFLGIVENPLLTNTGEGDSDRNLFDLISKFKAATSIQIQHNDIRSIPDEGFGPLPNLKMFVLGSWNLVRIGSRAFSQLPSLELAELSSCDISIDEIADDAFEGVGPNAEISMEHNPFSRLPAVPFKPLLDNARAIAVGGQDCTFLECTDIQFDCDEESAWMCQDVEKYQPKVKGFVCRNESSYGNIWDYCAGEINNK